MRPPKINEVKWPRLAKMLLLGLGLQCSVVHAGVTDSVTVTYTQSETFAVSMPYIEDQLKKQAFSKMGKVMREIGNANSAVNQFSATLTDMKIITKDGYITATATYNFNEKSVREDENTVLLPDDFFWREEKLSVVNNLKADLQMELDKKHLDKISKEALTKAIKLNNVRSCKNSNVTTSTNMNTLVSEFDPEIANMNKDNSKWHKLRDLKDKIELHKLYQKYLSLLVTGEFDSGLSQEELIKQSDPNIDTDCLMMVFDYKERNLFEEFSKNEFYEPKKLESIYQLNIFVNGEKYTRRIYRFFLQEGKLKADIFTSSFPTSLKAMYSKYSGLELVKALYNNTSYPDRDELEKVKNDILFQAMSEQMSSRSRRVTGTKASGKVWVSHGQFHKGYFFGISVWAKTSFKLNKVSYSFERIR